MPIANCIVTDKYRNTNDKSLDLVTLWANESFKPAEHMTINIISCNEQYGNQYGVMANLQIPTIWSSNDISLLQLGLVKALSIYFKAPMNDIHVVTTLISSGMVIEDGEVITWSV